MKPLRLSCLLLLLMAIAGCELRQAMFDQPKYQPLQASEFFSDGMSARQPVLGTVAQGELDAAEGPERGLPASISSQLLARGQERYNIFCVPCHDSRGLGQGSVVLKGFKQPPSLLDKRLVAAPEKQLYQVIQNGRGMMDGMAAQISDPDRWAIVAYLRVLQGRSPVSALPALERNIP